MKLKAFGCGLKSEDHELIQKIASTFGQEAEIADLYSYDAKLDIDDTVIVFGKKAEQLIKTSMHFSCTRILYLPELNLLKDIPENVSTRKDAWNRLKSFRERASSGEVSIPVEALVITESTLPDLSTEQLKALGEILHLRKIESWKGKTKDGKSIVISLSPLDPGVADVVMTFSELFTLKMAMDILRLEKIEFVSDSKVGGN